MVMALRRRRRNRKAKLRTKAKRTFGGSDILKLDPYRDPSTFSEGGTGVGLEGPGAF